MEENRIQEQNNGEMTAVAQPAKENLAVRALHRIERGWVTFKATKTGKVVVTVGKWGARIGALVGVYKLGEKHAKPQYIYVTDGVVEDAAPEEEDPIEPTDEELEKMVEEEITEE